MVNKTDMGIYVETQIGKNHGKEAENQFTMFDNVTKFERNYKRELKWWYMVYDVRLGNI